jgi:hypothetical protein
LRDSSCVSIKKPKSVLFHFFFPRFTVAFSRGFTFSTSAITSLNGRGMSGIGFELGIFFGLNSLLLWLVVALSFVLLLAASLFGFFLHLSEFLLLFGRKDGLNLRSRSLVDLLHLFSLLTLSQ